VVGERAVGPGQQRAVIRRDEHRAPELAEVPHRPRREHEEACRGARGPARPAAGPPPHRHGQREQRQQQQRLAAGERRERDHRAQRGRRARAAAVAHAEGHQQRGGHQHAVERLAEQRRVGADEHRVARGHQRGRHARPLAAHAPCQQPDQDDRERAQHATGRAMGVRARAARPGHAAEHQLPERRVPRARHVVPAEQLLERLHEPVPTGDQVRAAVEEVPVAHPPHVARRAEEHDQAHDEAEARNQDDSSHRARVWRMGRPLP
jgi:hypothetical protein